MVKGKPNKITLPNKEEYVLAIALIATKADGKPKLVSFIGETETVSLAGGEEFMTLYVPKNMVRK